MSLRKIGERTFWGKQGLEPREYLAPRSRDKAVANSRDINQILFPVIPNNYGIHSVCARNVATDHKFLPAVQSILSPRAAAFSSFVPAVFSLSNDTFQPLGASGSEHVPSRRFKIVRNADSGRLKLKNAFHYFMALDERKAREITIVVNKKVENEVVNARGFCPVVLEEIEVWSARFI